MRVVFETSHEMSANTVSGSFVYAPVIGFTKLSVLAIYWSAFPTARYLKRAVVATGALVVGWAFACCLVGLMACLPIRASWTPELQPSARCINMNGYYYGLQIPNIITDVMILILPWKAVYDLSKSQGLQVRQTVALFGIFSLGIVTIVFDIVRLVVLIRTRNVSANSVAQRALMSVRSQNLRHASM